jgi:MerR family transcriptional regulator/heat shock protein HspR
MTNQREIERSPSSSQLTYTIGEAADILGISIPSLRLYEREGLIIPFRRGSRHRRYTAADLERVRCVREMINKHKVSIAGMQHLLSLIPCWKIKHCPEDVRPGCPAFQQHATPCWMVSNKPWECRNQECRVCSVYTDFSDCQSLKKSISFFTFPVTENAASRDTCRQREQEFPVKQNPALQKVSKGTEV